MAVALVGLSPDGAFKEDDDDDDPPAENAPSEDAPAESALAAFRAFHIS
jgi:hypothetical protein